MFDIGGLELLVIGVVALIVVGPKDLPGMFRTVGQFVGKMRGMAREFQRSMEAAAKESGLKEASDTLKNAGNMARDPLSQVKSSAATYAKKVAGEAGPEGGPGAKKAAETAAAATTDAGAAPEAAATPAAAGKTAAS